uniref:Uncharacterized protein n=1 Tax=Globodera rostochiensis TaxID=31243 RepID=A0A914H7F4_GLORO
MCTSVRRRSSPFLDLDKYWAAAGGGTMSFGQKVPRMSAAQRVEEAEQDVWAPPFGPQGALKGHNSSCTYPNETNLVSIESFCWVDFIFKSTSSKKSYGTSNVPGAQTAGPKRPTLGGGPSLSSSSGIDSSLADAKEFDLNSMRLARRQLIECRRKVARLVKSAEKTQRGERLGRNDLFGSSVHEDSTPCCSVGVHSSTQAQLDEQQVAQIDALRKEMEVLHDKFIILYARGTF